MHTTDSRFERFQSSLEAEGERAGLAYLNSQAGFRFTAVIHFADGRGNPIHFFDRDNPEVTDAEELDQRASYCNAVITLREPFHTDNSIVDERLVHHPVRQTVRSYLGVPILGTDGAPQAVLCSFDPFPRTVADSDRNLLLRAAEVFSVRMAGYQLSPPASRVTIVRTEKIGSSILSVVERIKPGWSTPRYTIERTRKHADGSSSHRLSYGRDGFDSMEEALEFGREWCLALGDE